MSSRTLPDERARERVRTDLDTNFLVEAGAGTGKTRLLVDRIESLVATGRTRLRNVVAITFTEKAAAELRVQIRQRIEGALRSAEGEGRERLRTALADLEIAPVSTIHAFVADLLRERPVEAGVDPGFTVVDELRASLFRTEAWDRWLEQQKDAAPEALRDAVEYGISLRQLRAVGDVLLRYRDVFDRDLERAPQPEDPLKWLRRAEPTIRRTISRVARDCLDQQDRAVPDLGALGQALDLFARVSQTEVRRSVLAGALKLKIGGNQSNWRTGILKKIKDDLLGLHEELERLRAAHGHWLAASAMNWLRSYVAEYQALKAREGVIDFDDLLLIARNLLRDNKAVRRDFQVQFQAILVDEFQDTDPLQAEIIFYLAEDGATADSWKDVRLRSGKLFIVGDPKQSIYAFRRADIETYELAKKVLDRSGDVEFITANFRSIKEILKAVNATFKGYMVPPTDGTYQPQYIDLEESTRTRESSDAPPLILLYPDSATVGDDETKAARREHEAEAVAALLRHYIDAGIWKAGEERRTATFGDVAMLFRGMADVPTYEDALKRYDIPYRVTSSRTFHRREEVGWLLNVLHAVEHPTDAIAVWGALRSPFFGCSDREIFEYVTSGSSFDYRVPAKASPPEGIGAAWALLSVFHQERNRWSVPRMVEEVLLRTHALSTFLLTPQGEQRVANLLKVVTLARALEESGILTFRAFVHWLRDMEEQAVDEAESPTVEEGDNVVRIMSIHAAKGLEFPIVVIPDLARRSGGATDHVLLQRVKNEAAIFVGKVGQAWEIQTGNYERLKVEHGNREAAERIRVLYVAMTRAKDALVLPVFPEQPAGTMMADLAHILPTTPRFGRRHMGWLQVNGTDISEVPGEPPPVRLSLPAGPTPEGARLLDERTRWLAERGAAVTSASVPQRVIVPSGLVNRQGLTALKAHGARLEAEPGGVLLGALVHEILAVIPLDRPDLADDFARYFAAKRGVTGRLVERVAEMVMAALASDLIGAARAARSWREVPFAMDGPHGVVEGAIDLVAEDAGAVTVVDFKTDQVSSDLDAEIRAAYQPQLDAYADVVRKLGIEKVDTQLLLVRQSLLH